MLDIVEETQIKGLSSWENTVGVEWAVQENREAVKKMKLIGAGQSSP